MLKDRLKSAAVLLTVAFTAFFVPGNIGTIVFCLLCSFLLFNGLKEFFNFTERLGMPAFRKLATVMSFLYFGCTLVYDGFYSCSGLRFAPQILMQLLIICSFLVMFRHEDLKKGTKGMAATLAGFFYITWPLTFIVQIYLFASQNVPATDCGRYLALYMILVTKSSDIGAYFTGSTTAKLLPGGNHKIAPVLSPKKSWEGFFGGVLFSMFVGFMIMFLATDKLVFANARVVTVWFNVIFAFLAATLGIIGDVAESTFKRASELKDSGSILPGMGGAMDVLDSLIPVAPLFYFYVLLVTS